MRLRGASEGPSLPFERVSALARKRRERLLGIVDELRNTRPIYAELGAPDEASTIKKVIEEFLITERWSSRASLPSDGLDRAEVGQRVPRLTTPRVKAAAVPRS